MAKDKENKKNKKHVIDVKKRADGTEDVIINKAPQKTTLGKIVIIILAAGLALGAIISLIIVMIQL